MTIQLQFIIQCQILCILCLLCIFMKTVIIVRLYFDHFHILWDYTQKWINGKIKMMMMMMMTSLYILPSPPVTLIHDQSQYSQINTELVCGTGQNRQMKLASRCFDSRKCLSLLGSAKSGKDNQQYRTMAAYQELQGRKWLTYTLVPYSLPCGKTALGSNRKQSWLHPRVGLDA